VLTTSITTLVLYGVSVKPQVTYPARRRSRLPPCANCAKSLPWAESKDGAPSALVMPARSKAWATPRQGYTSDESGSDEIYVRGFSGSAQGSADARANGWFPRVAEPIPDGARTAESCSMWLPTGSYVSRHQHQAGIWGSSA